MKSIADLHQQLKDKYLAGTVQTKDYLELLEERRIENGYAERFGIRSGIGIEEGGTTNKTNEVTAFFIGRDVVLFDEDARKVKGAIEAYAVELEKKDPETLSGSERMVQARIRNGRLRIDQVDGVDRLVLWGVHYNDWLMAIYKQGIGFLAYNIDDARV